MKLIERLPGIGKKVSIGKHAVVGMINKSVDSQYKKALNNFLVLGMGLETGVPIPKVVESCERFFKSNWKESKFSEETCNGLHDIFSRIELGEFESEDGVWVREVFVPYLRGRQTALKFEVMKKTLR